MLTSNKCTKVLMKTSKVLMKRSNMIDEDIILMLDNLPVGIVRLDCNKNCMYANKFIMKAISASSFADIKESVAKYVHNEDVEIEKQACRDFLFSFKESETIFRLYNVTLKSYVWMSNKRTLIRNSDDNCYSYMYTYEDINTNKLMEIKLRNETIKAEQAYNHKTIFLANMSHEIRTPINGIIGMLTLLEDTPLSVEQQDYINMVKECSFNLMTIINDILDYSKLEVGKITLDVKPMNLQECIESTNDIILSKVYEKSLEYTYNIDKDTPRLLNGDTNRIKQVLLNLLTNAIKFTDKGTIFLEINTITREEYDNLMTKHIRINKFLDEDSLFLRFDITDTGCGINAEDTQKLFQSFSQIDNNLTSKVYQGTGLGLAISKELVQLMNGCIWLEWSDANKGSKFSFIIGCTRLKEDEYTPEEIYTFDLHGLSVLIVDDNIHNRISLAGIVSKWGMKAHSFSNGEEALYNTKIMRFDIGLIDICMPKCDGPTFASKLREQKEFDNKNIPLIALSSLGDKTTASSSIFKTHLTKPIKETKLKQICIDSLRTYPRKTTVEPKKESLNNYIANNEIFDLRDNIRILLAEDVYINRRVIVSFLKKIGFSNIQVVENGQQCLDYVQSKEYDIILLDIRMPIITGDVVLQTIQQHYKSSNKKLPYIVAVTAYCLREDKDKYLSMGFNDYIPKPVSVSDLTRCMERFTQSLLHD